MMGGRMNKIQRCLVLAAGAVLAVSLAAQSGLEWAVSFGDQESDDESGYFSLNGDNSGNLYVSGTYIYSIAFGSHVLATPQTGQDIYLAKKAVSGEWLWAVSAVGSAASEGRNYVDLAGNCFLYGEYLNTLTFGDQTLSNSYSTSRKQAFIAQVDSGGNWLWAQNIALNYLNGLCRDSAGSFFLCGYIIDPVNSIFESKALKLDSALQPVWTTLLSTEPLYTKEIHLDQNGWIECVAKEHYLKLTPGGTIVLNLTLPGIYMDFAFAAEGSKYYRGYADEPLVMGSQSVPVGGFLAKMVNSEYWAWVLMDSSPDYGYGGGVAVNAAGEVYITGSFTGSRTFGDLTLTNSGGADIFIAKASSGGVWQWGKQGGGQTAGDAVRYNGIEIGPTGNIYPWGNFRGTLTLGNDTVDSVSPLFSDQFLAQFLEPTLNLLTPEPGDIWYLDNPQLVTWDHTCDWQPREVDFCLVPQTAPHGLIYIDSDDVDAETLTVDVLVDDIPPGNYDFKGTLSGTTVESSVPITIANAVPIPPQNVRCEVSGNNIIVTWDPVTQDANGNPITPSGYQVYVSANPNAGFFAYGTPATGTTFTDYNVAVAYGRRFYRIVALVNQRGNP